MSKVKQSCEQVANVANKNLNTDIQATRTDLKAYASSFTMTQIKECRQELNKTIANLNQRVTRETSLEGLVDTSLTAELAQKYGIYCSFSSWLQDAEKLKAQQI